MELYFAPLEGITSYLYRNTHQEMFPGMARYYTPFVTPTSSSNFKSREKKDVIPEHNQGIPVVPQILSNAWKEFVYTGQCLMDYGYSEVNLNLGCPSGTVVGKGRGSGFLALLPELNEFLEQIFTHSDFPISIKTRIGKEDPEEFEKILEIYNQYPIRELIIHPRVQREFYKNKPHLDIFAKALQHSKAPVCYNGDISTVSDYEQFIGQFPSVDRIMIGRGLIANPALVRQIQGGAPLELSELFVFSKVLTARYREVMPEVPVLYKMKELWFYMSREFPEPEKVWKKVRKTKKLQEYENVIRMMEGTWI